MTLLDTLKSLLGLESTDGRPEGASDVGVTVEREPGEQPGAPGAAGGEAESGEPEPVSSPAAGSGAAEVEPEPTEDAEPEPTETEAEQSEEPEPADEAAAGTDEPTDVLEGIGPAYAERLADAGIDTVADLAGADVAELAETTEISESRLERWIDRARDR